MSGWIRQSKGGRGLFALLLLCVLAIRIAIPTGYMPTVSEQGVVISLCTGQGAINVVMPVDGHDDQGDYHSQSKECAFAAGLGNGLVHPPLNPAPAVIAILAVVPLSRAIADLTVHRLAAPPPPSQAPPAHR